MVFWNARDLERKLKDFQHYYNHHCVHSTLGGQTPAEVYGAPTVKPVEFDYFHWEKHCRGLVQVPRAAQP
jgi:hypothetical protein